MRIRGVTLFLILSLVISTIGTTQTSFADLSQTTSLSSDSPPETNEDTSENAEYSQQLEEEGIITGTDIRHEIQISTHALAVPLSPDLIPPLTLERPPEQ